MLDLGENLRKLILAGVGIAAVTKEKGADVLNELVKKGELTIEQGKVLNEELKHNIKDAIRENVTIVTPPDDVISAVDSLSDEQLEALKAQAAAERTYVYYQLAQGRKDAHPDADFCTDHTCCSAYLSETAAKEKWAADFAPWNTRVVQAVADTDGLVALYDGEPILAVFHSSSAGRTAAGDVWSGDLPYLASVASPESADTVPNYYSTVTFTAAEAKDRLLAAHPEIKLTGAPETWFGAVTENDSGRVETVSVGGTDIEGTEMRRIFSLRSACFTLTADAESVTFRVTGYGHGVGMSQYGAELAKAG